MKVLLGICIWLVTLLFLGLPLAMFSLYKCLIIFFNSGTIRQDGILVGDERDVMYPIAAADVMFALGSSWEKSIVNTGFVLRFQKSVEAKRVTLGLLRDHFHNCFLTDQIPGGRYERFFSYLIVHRGHPFRVNKKNIDLDKQIVEVNLGEKDEKTMSVEQFLAEWMLTGYEKEEPCWNITLISSKDCQYMAFKIHHAQADGYSVLHILDRLTENTSPYLVKDFPERPLHQFKQLLEGPTNLEKLVGIPQNPFSVKLSGATKEWMVSFTHFPLDKLKQIRKTYGVHMTSVILTIISGAMREFLKDEMEVQVIPEYIKIGNTLPWPRHPSRNFTIPNKDKLCNHWIAAILKIPLRNTDCISRMNHIEADLQAYKQSGLDKFTKRVMLPLMWTMPAVVLESAVGSDPGIGAGVTSMVGGDNYSLLGCNAEGIHPFLAIHDNNPFVPLSCFTFSHSGKMEVTIGAHPSVFKKQLNLDSLCHKLCHKEYNQLLSRSTKQVETNSKNE